MDDDPPDLMTAKQYSDDSSDNESDGEADEPDDDIDNKRIAESIDEEGPQRADCQVNGQEESDHNEKKPEVEENNPAEEENWEVVYCSNLGVQRSIRSSKHDRNIIHRLADLIFKN